MSASATSAFVLRGNVFSIEVNGRKSETATLSEHGMLPALGPRRRRHRVVVEDCSVAPV